VVTPLNKLFAKASLSFLSGSSDSGFLTGFGSSFLILVLFFSSGLYTWIPKLFYEVVLLLIEPLPPEIKSAELIPLLVL